MYSQIGNVLLRCEAWKMKKQARVFITSWCIPVAEADSHLPQHCRGLECPCRERKGSLVCRWRKDNRGPAPLLSAATSARPPSGTLGKHRRPCIDPSFVPIGPGTPLPTYSQRKGKFLERKPDTCPRCPSSPASWSKGNLPRWKRGISFAPRSW